MISTEVMKWSDFYTVLTDYTFLTRTGVAIIPPAFHFKQPWSCIPKPRIGYNLTLKEKIIKLGFCLSKLTYSVLVWGLGPKQSEPRQDGVSKNIVVWGA